MSESDTGRTPDIINGVNNTVYKCGDTSRRKLNFRTRYRENSQRREIPSKFVVWYEFYVFLVIGHLENKILHEKHERKPTQGNWITFSGTRFYAQNVTLIPSGNVGELM